MSADLSPEEIDALQNELKTADARSVRLIDFSDKEWLEDRARHKILNSGETLARELTAVFRKALPVNLPRGDVALAAVRKDRVSEQFEQLGCAMIINHPRHGVIAVAGPDRRLSYALIEQAFGAPGLREDGAVHVPDRSMTEIEYQALASVLGEAASAVMDFTGLGDEVTIESRPSTDLGVQAQSPTICWQLDLGLGCFSLLSSHEWVSFFSSSKPQEAQASIARHLDRIPISLDFVLGELNIGLSELRNWQKGSVFALPVSTGHPLRLCAHGKTIFSAVPSNEAGLIGARLEAASR